MQGQPPVQKEGTEKAVIRLGSETRQFQCVTPPPPRSSLRPDTDHTPEESIIRQRDSFWSPVFPQRAAFPEDKGERLLFSELWTPSQNTSERIPRGRLQGVPEMLALPAQAWRARAVATPSPANPAHLRNLAQC